MLDQQLIDHIKQQLQQGVDKDTIKKSLLANNWQEKDIEEAFYVISNSPNPAQQSIPQQATFSLPGGRAILNQAWPIYKQRLGTFLGIMFIQMTITVAFTFILLNILSSGDNLSFKFGETTAGIWSPKILPVALIYIILFINYAWGLMALIYAIKDREEGIGVLEAYRRGLRKIHSFLWLTFLGGMIIYIGLLFFIIPGIIFAVWFSLSTFILIAEDLKGIKALKKSKEYVKGYWGAVFWRFLFIFLVFFAISLAVLLIFRFLQIPFLEMIINFILGLFLPPLATIYLFLVYSNLKILKG